MYTHMIIIILMILSLHFLRSHKNKYKKFVEEEDKYWSFIF